MIDVGGAKMIVDITGTVLTPGKYGRDCLGNGNHQNQQGEYLCCCDECDYYQCCIEEHSDAECLDCEDGDCPRAQMKK